MNELEPALTLGEQHELNVAAARMNVQDLSQLEAFDGDTARTMRNQIAMIPEMYSQGAIEITPLTQRAPDVFYKDERQQVTGAFKPRGAFTNCWFTLENDPSVRELAACSAGNHAQGVGHFVNWHNTHFGWGLRAHAFIAETASDAKKDSLRTQGAYIHDQGLRSLEEARAAAQEFVRVSGRPAAEIQPYAAPETIAGQGTIMTEIIMQLWEAGVDTRNQPLVVRVGWGGGGLALGTAEVIKQLISKGYAHPDSKVIAVEEQYNDSGRRGVARYAEGGSTMHGLFAPGEFSASNDGTAVQIADLMNVAMAHRYSQEGLLEFDCVTKAQVGQAMIENPGTEPAGALAIASHRQAAVRSLDSPLPLEVCVVSGGNLTEDKYTEYRQACEEAVVHRPNSLGGYVIHEHVVVENRNGYRAPEEVLAAYADQLSDWGVELLPESVQRPAPPRQ